MPLLPPENPEINEIYNHSSGAKLLWDGQSWIWDHMNLGGKKGPIAKANGPYAGEQGLGVTFSSAGSYDRDGYIAAFNWSFGDGSPDSSESNPIHTYSGAGDYTVTLTVTDNTGLSNSDSTTAAVTGANLAPTADPGGPYAPTQNVAFQADGSLSSDPDGTITQYDWDWGDGNTSPNAGATPTHTYTTAVGSPFTVSLTVTDNEGATHAATTSATVSAVNQDPTADPGGPYTPTVNVAFSADGSASSDPDGTIVQYDWDWGDENQSLNAGATPTHTYTTTVGSPFTVVLTVTDNDGATNSATTTATVSATNQAPTANPGGPYTPTVNVAFSADGSASSDPDGTITQYDWDWGDGNTSPNAGATPSHTYTTQVGSPFTVGLTVTDNNGATDTATTTATVGAANQAPVANAGGPYTPTVNVAFSADGSASSDPDGTITQYDWDWGDGNTSPNAGATPSHTYTTTVGSPFTVGLTVTDNDGATNSATTTATVTANQAPVADAGGPYAPNINEAFTADGSASSDPDGTIAQYDWDWGDGNTSPNAGATPSHTYTTAVGSPFTVSLTVTDNEGATNTATTSATVNNNPIIAENQLTPTAATEWDLRGDITSGANAGFARQQSYNVGDTVQFAVDTAGATTAATTIRILRLGHYDGTNHAREVASVVNTPTTQANEATITGSNNGTDCTGWTNTASWTIPADAVSGLYIGLVDGSPRQLIYFVVRNDAHAADVVCVIPVNTHNAYNSYGGPLIGWNGGRCLYGIGFTNNWGERTFCVSFHRPYNARNRYNNSHTSYDYAAIDALEEQGYNVKYISDVDLDGGTAWLGGSRIVMIEGHNEYWTDGMVNNCIALREAGVHLFFAGGNLLYWRVRYDATNPHLMWCYKDTHDHSDTGYVADTDPNSIDPVSPFWTGVYYDSRSASKSGGAFTPIEPQDVTNAFFKMTETASPYRDIVVPAATYQSVPIWRDTVIAGGASKTFTGAFGFEGDENRAPADGRPWLWATEQTMTLTNKCYNDDGSLPVGTCDIQAGVALSHSDVTHGVTFSLPAMNWLWKWTNYHTMGTAIQDADARQMLVNVMADMGATADTIDQTLTVPTPVDFVTGYGMDYSPDPIIANGPFEVVIGTPINFSSAGSAVWDGTIQSYLWDFGDGNTSTLANPSHTYAATNTYTVTLTITDSSARSGQTTSSAVVTAAPRYDIFQGLVPQDLNVNFGARYVVGIRFNTAANGKVIGVTAHSSQAGMFSEMALYQRDGTLLGSETITDPGGGHNTYNFTTPIDVVAEGEYVAAVLMATNFLDRDPAGFFDATSYTNQALTAPAWTASDGNPRSIASTTMQFPSGTASSAANSQRYGGVDVEFEEGVTPPVVVTTGPYAEVLNIAFDIDASGSYDPNGTVAQIDIDPGDGSGYQLNVPGGVLNHTYTSGTNYTISVRVTDNDGLQTVDTTTVTLLASAPYNVFGATTPVDSNVNFSARYVYGIAFETATNGNVTGVRLHSSQAGMAVEIALYQVDTINAPVNTGTGTLLASRTITDPGGGWNEFNFDTPVPITTGNQYVVCKLASGNFTDRTVLFFDTATTTNDITVIASDNDTDGNGRLLESNIMGYPNLWSTNPTSPTRNQWHGVDVLFSAG